ncbi:MAG: hypothetical protein ACOYOP_15065 [Microthrixaceae bacterium]
MAESLRFGTAHRKWSVVAVVLLGLVLLALALTAQVTAPLVLYPFA